MSLWRKRNNLYTLTFEVLQVTGNVVRGRFVSSGSQCVMSLDPSTGGPVGYELVQAQEVTP